MNEIDERALQIDGGSRRQAFPVSGTGIDFARDAIVHSEQATPTRVVKRLTEVVRLDGDLSGYVLYQPTQVFDLAANTLTVTGTNVFSGTIVGSEPILLRSVESRFEVDLATGEETGSVRLSGSHDPMENGWFFECDLVIEGTGQTPDGNNTFAYHGLCGRGGRCAPVSSERRLDPNMED